ncbi:metallopeptidase TldD-related protein [Azospirillum sp. TSO22-1]|uniref:TldD/PmbA family protein n=1 Tax=Azospirillum sp. TSO22-1 TaxID=716789 RepID=UPI000D620F5C|nr:metallopeptidase TldD-related protein [Azospirillum sp. TSO22-1]PWC31987.1 modulator protein [Azospirillum sp. TSO22-1]
MTDRSHTEAAATLDLLDDLVRRAAAAGADDADAVAADGVSLTAASRFGALERVIRAESRKLGLRVFVGRRQAIVSTADRTPRALADLVERAVAMARAVPEDPFCGLAEPGLWARSWPDLDLCDPAKPDPAELAGQARAAEEAALAVPGVVNSRTVEASWSRSVTALVASNGFAGAHAHTRRSLLAWMLAGDGTVMERDHEHDTTVHAADLRNPAGIGRRAGERAAARLGARKVGSRRVPVVFEPRTAASLLDHLVAAVSGPAVARGTSFLKDRLGQPVFPAGVTVVDDPLRRRGLRSRPFDAEGMAVAPRAIVEDGRLAGWLLDLRSARQLGLAGTGHAARGVSGPPGPAPSNIHMAAGRRSRDSLLGEIRDGLYVTELMGMGVNPVTGDYSRGASGFWIEDGQLAYPVSELTVAGNLKDMFLNLEAADDLDARYGMDAPTVRIDGMTVAGL